MPILSLFDEPRTDDIKSLVQKSKSTKKPSSSVKGGGGIASKISQIVDKVEKHLGGYADEYQIIQDEAVLHDYISACIDNHYISIDTETTGLDPLLDQLAGICIYTRGQKSSYIPVNHINYITEERVSNQLPIDFIATEFKRLFDSKVDIDMFNASFDIRVFRHNKMPGAYCTWDGYLASRLLNENEPLGEGGLKKLHQKYVLNGEGDAFSFDELFKKVPFTKVPIKTGYLYAAHDPIITTELCDFQRQYLREDSDREDMRQLYWVMKNIEMPCVEVVADMEDNGVLFDTEYQKQLSVKYAAKLNEVLTKFYTQLAEYQEQIDEYTVKHPDAKLDNPINVNSPTQLAILFYDILGYESVDRKSPRGTGEAIVSQFHTQLADTLLEYRGLDKLINTYIEKLPNCVNPNDGRIHCKFNQYGADTGRFSSQDPNLQNIPSHAKDVRPLFVASPGYVLMSSDYSQQEPSCLATFCKQAGSDALFDARFKGNDLYSEVASACFNTPYEECCEFDKDGHKNPPEYKERRNQAKPILLGILYGRGDNSVAEQLGCRLEDAQQLKTNLFKRFPEIQKFEQDSLNMAREIGYVTTVCGRKRRLPELQLDEFEFKWKNGKVQTDDLLDFENKINYDVPDDIADKYWRKLKKCRYNEKYAIIQEAAKEGIQIIDNGAKIAAATRQCVNARIQGSAADLTKLALIELNRNERLKELGFRLLIPVHDEVIAECPEEDVKECAKLLADTMSKAAEEILKMPFSCDVECSRAWYGESIEI